MVAHLVRIRAGKSRRPCQSADGARPQSRVSLQFADQDVPLSRLRTKEMRELRAQAGGDPLRMLYSFDPRSIAILLVAGDKTGDDRWYDTNVPIADRLFERHLRMIEKERDEHG